MVLGKCSNSTKRTVLVSVKNGGKTLTRSPKIIDAVWKVTDEVPFDQVIDVYIKELRKKLDLDCILTVPEYHYTVKGNMKRPSLFKRFFVSIPSRYSCTLVICCIYCIYFLFLLLSRSSSGELSDPEKATEIAQTSRKKTVKLSGKYLNFILK